LFYWIFKATVLAALRLWFRPMVEGTANVPAGAAIIASNHLSFSDSFFLGAVLSRRLTFLAKSSYFDTPGVAGWLTARLFRALGQIPIDRAGGVTSDGAIHAGADVLLSGGLLGVYPEGTRSPDGRLYRGRTGVARLALTGRCPVVPVGVIGTDMAQPPGSRWLRKVPVRIVFGPAMVFPADLDLNDGGAPLREITDEIVRNIWLVSGQDYVDEYSPGPGLT
jgi:1-acyl-sn-glycerol-3-phosphate acyltransferase